MKHTLSLLACLFVFTLGAQAQSKPSPYPISWELQFDYSKPRRIVVTPPGGGAPQGYWYLTYTITNHGKQEVTYLPIFHMLIDDGSLIRSDGYRYLKVDGQVQPVMRWIRTEDGQTTQGREVIPANVIEEIRKREKNPHLEPVYLISGSVRLGEDQAREGVAVWPEPDPRMGHFSVLVGGLSGESTTLKDAQGNDILRDTKDGKKPIVLNKTLKIDYQMLGDGRIGDDSVQFSSQEWIMR